MSSLYPAATDADDTDSTPEMEFADAILIAWAAWVYGGGKLNIATYGDLMDLGVKLIGHIDLSEDKLMVIDNTIAHLPGRMRNLVNVHYRSSDDEPMTRRYLRVGYGRSEYRLQLKAVQAALYALLMPQVKIWQHNSGY